MRIEADPAPAREEPEVFHLWPENVRTWGLFLECSSQWRTSMDGREGLDLPGVEIILRRSGLPRDRRDQAWHDIMAMQFACLEVWANRRSERERD
ncbi:DUF1799 domain-containing protein [Ramlibacter sp. Leaf400]|uniref:DUF1799 domain-containing protein n=1 Tax=Ramlibacter sp. Leaf400 TaxID=1736365 RepID=UPI0006F3756E|nr:DUF1799 domain-containing protein [Ramlibacter sp. Leaf400]KQT10963.1 hypothetical protein ASG30_09195 [Ramlibacter sp. Leaf400]